MNWTILTTISLFALACGSSVPTHQHPEPLSATEHEEHAKGHETEGEKVRERVEPGSEANATVCVDQGVPLESGGEEIRVMKPCWTQAEQNAAYLRAADEHRKAAREHRTWARQLIEVEAAACGGLGAIERTTSPFVRTPDILSVKEYREAGELRGARVIFRKVEGLSREWLTRSMKCHQARAAKLGYAKEFMPHCPLALPKVAIGVVEKPDTVVVTVRSTDPITAAEIYGRADLARSEDAAMQP